MSTPDTRTSLDVVESIAQENPNLWFTICKYKVLAQQSHLNGHKNALKRLLTHKENNDFALIPAICVTKYNLLEMCAELPSDWRLAFRSTAKTVTGRKCFFPLMDFSIPRGNGDRIGAIKYLLSEIHRLHKYRGYGYLLETTKSYHYYGTCPLRKADWLKFLGRFLLSHPRDEDYKTLGFSAMVDTRFIGHALLAGQGSLRISADAYSELPKVVATVESTKSDDGPC